MNGASSSFTWEESGWPGEENGKVKSLQSFDEGDNAGPNPQDSQDRDDGGVFKTAYRKEI